MTVARQPGQKARPPGGVSDREIRSRAHDELVNWLIVHLADAVAFQFGVSQLRRERLIRKAIAEWPAAFRRELDRARHYLDTLPPDSPIRTPLSAMIDRATSAYAAFAPPAPRLTTFSPPPSRPGPASKKSTRDPPARVPRPAWLRLSTSGPTCGITLPRDFPSRTGQPRGAAP